jgi:uncharacterized membrane protein YqaE (UPF0057 family)
MEIIVDNKIVQIIAALILPPLAVYMKTRKIGGTFWINVILTLLGGVPGILHALYVVLM